MSGALDPSPAEGIKAAALHPQAGPDPPEPAAMPQGTSAFSALLSETPHAAAVSRIAYWKKRLVPD